MLITWLSVTQRLTKDLFIPRCFEILIRSFSARSEYKLPFTVVMASASVTNCSPAGRRYLRLSLLFFPIFTNQTIDLSTRSLRLPFPLPRRFASLIRSFANAMMSPYRLDRKLSGYTQGILSVRDNRGVTQFVRVKTPWSEASDEARRWLRTPGQVYQRT